MTVDGVVLRKKREQHKLSHTPEYTTWDLIVQRCTNPHYTFWCNYGGRGIKICDEWRNSFSKFLNYVGYRPSNEYTIDRIDNNGNYEPGNVRWATRTEQQRNTRRNREITFNGKTQCLQAWADEFNVDYQYLQRLLAKGHSFDKVGVDECRNGHIYTFDTTYYNKRGRRCKICTTLTNKKWRENHV